eukprot:SAG31_NODE_5030_length_2793_cov_1.858575_2_plen_81_part_00
MFLFLRDKVAIDSVADDDVAIGRDQFVLLDGSPARIHSRTENVVAVLATLLQLLEARCDGNEARLDRVLEFKAAKVDIDC